MVKIRGKKRDLRELSRKVKKKIDLKLSAGSTKIKKIDEIAITPTMKCSLDCAMCHQGQIKDWENMNYESFKKILVNLKKSKVSKVSLVGGEIFVHLDMWKFIDLLEEMDFKYDLSSNLFFVPKLDKLIKLKGLEMVTTSIDGLGKLHDKIRGREGAFEKTMGYVEKLIEAGIFVDVACVVQKANFKDLEKIIEYLCKKGVKRLTLIMENSIPLKQRAHMKMLLKKLSGVDSNIILTSLDNPLGKLTEEDYKKIPKKMKKIKEIVKKYGATLGSTIQFDNPEVLDKKTSLKNYTCSSFNGYGMTVYSDNSIHQCCFVKVLSGKNIIDTPPLEILNSKEYRSIRDYFKKHGAFEMCRLCCALKKK